MGFTVSMASGFSGVHMGLVFTNGTAHTNDAFLATRLHSKGYAVERNPDEADTAPIADDYTNTDAHKAAPAAPELESLTVAQLKELALADGIDLGSAKTKADIIAAITAAME
ncbi:MAG: hypothetical protein ACI4I2_02005 [Oscillospiraceae bacterium]